MGTKQLKKAQKKSPAKKVPVAPGSNKKGRGKGDGDSESQIHSLREADGKLEGHCKQSFTSGPMEPSADKETQALSKRRKGPFLCML